MQHILVYADSLSWGIVPTGTSVRVIEDCLNGRRTVWDDPFKPGRNGLVGLAQRIEIHSPLALVVLLLGTNDFQSMHAYNAWHSAQGIAALVSAIRSAPIEPGMPVPPVLVVAPPLIGSPKGPIAPKFEGGELLRLEHCHHLQQSRRRASGRRTAFCAGHSAVAGGRFAASYRHAPATGNAVKCTAMAGLSVRKVHDAGFRPLPP